MSNQTEFSDMDLKDIQFSFRQLQAAFENLPQDPSAREGREARTLQDLVARHSIELKEDIEKALGSALYQRHHPAHELSGVQIKSAKAFYASLMELKADHTNSEKEATMFSNLFKFMELVDPEAAQSRADWFEAKVGELGKGKGKEIVMPVRDRRSDRIAALSKKNYADEDDDLNDDVLVDGADDDSDIPSGLEDEDEEMPEVGDTDLSGNKKDDSDAGLDQMEQE